MQNPMAFQVHYSDYQRQVGWVNANDWQIEKREKQYRVRKAVAKVLIQVASMLMPSETAHTPQTA